MSSATNLVPPPPIPADRELVKHAYRLTSDLARPNAAIYWADLLLSAAIGWGGFVLALHSGASPIGIAAAAMAALALYRGISFIHELVHLRRNTPRGFWTAWHILIGVPMLAPAFMYEGVHNLHHSKTHYGTEGDPEYLKLASGRLRDTPIMLLVAMVEPLFLVVRFLFITPAAALVPPIRLFVVERMSAMVMNPKFRRAEPPRPWAYWIAIEVAASLYAWAFVALIIAGVVPVAAGLLYLGLWSGISIVNMSRTLVAHHYDSDGEPHDVIEQLLDTASVPPPALLPMLWAPVGLRYHALHHLLPNLPYHALGEAHCRLMSALPAGNAYGCTAHRHAAQVLARLIRSQARSSRNPGVATPSSAPFPSN